MLLTTTLPHPIRPQTPPTPPPPLPSTGKAFLEQEYQKQRDWEQAHPEIVDYVHRISLQFKAEAERRMRAAAEVPFGPDGREAVQKMDPLQKAMWWVVLRQRCLNRALGGRRR